MPVTVPPSDSADGARHRAANPEAAGGGRDPPDRPQPSAQDEPLGQPDRGTEERQADRRAQGLNPRSLSRVRDHLEVRS